MYQKEREDSSKDVMIVAYRWPLTGFTEQVSCLWLSLQDFSQALTQRNPKTAGQSSSPTTPSGNHIHLPTLETSYVHWYILSSTSRSATPIGNKPTAKRYSHASISCHNCTQAYFARLKDKCFNVPKLRTKKLAEKYFESIKVIFLF